LKNYKKNPEAYIQDLEEKIIDLSIKLKTSNNLVAATETKHNTLISKLTHNLKNPIGIAYSFSDMILDDLENYTPEKLEKHLKIIKESSQYAISLLNTFVIFQQINSPNYTYNFELTNYIELLNNIIHKNTELAQNKNIIVLKSLPKDPIFTKIDSNKINLALEQLIGNAIRFSETNSKITITVTANNTSITTQIIDEGIGISNNNLANVFNDFFVVNTYDVDKKKCIGLGLPIAKKIIKEHSGTISIDSTINQGSSIKIILPICN